MNRKHKRMLSALLILALVLCGCAAKEAQPLQAAVRAALYSADGLMEFPPDELEMAADITAEDFAECVYLVSEDGVSARQVIALRARDEGKAQKIVKNLEGYLSRCRNETRDYLPEDHALLMNAKVERKKNTVVLIVGEKAAEETKKLLDGE